MTFQKGDLVKFWLNSECGVVTALIVNLFEKDLKAYGAPIVENWVTTYVLTDGIGEFPVRTYKIAPIRKAEEESEVPRP
jgi:hypothetical protein